MNGELSIVDLVIVDLLTDLGIGGAAPIHQFTNSLIHQIHQVN
jgi:hypothetical protein